MRKNGVNRELRVIAGGVCAPNGFKANGIHCGIAKAEKKDLALIAAERRCPTACVFAVNSLQSATATVTKKHIKNGLAQGILVNSGTANVFVESGEKLAEKACRLLAQYSDIDATDTVIASTGKVQDGLTLAPFADGMRELYKGLTDTDEGSLYAAQAIADEEGEAKQFSYAFDLGAFSCKIGGIYKGNMRVCPNMATTLVFLTTDVNISSEMLQKALSASVRDSMNMLCVDGISSPNDTVCIMANGKAGNYRISGEDTEYEKFVYILREVLISVCCRLAKDGDGQKRLFTCKVAGAKSKQIARLAAKQLLNAQSVKQMLLTGNVDAEGILYLLTSTAEDLHYPSLRISFATETEQLVVFEDGIAFEVDKNHLQKLMEEDEIGIVAEIGKGNYSAMAFGCLSPKLL